MTAPRPAAVTDAAITARLHQALENSEATTRMLREALGLPEPTLGFRPQSLAAVVRAHSGAVAAAVRAEKRPCLIPSHEGTPRLGSCFTCVRNAALELAARTAEGDWP